MKQQLENLLRPYQQTHLLQFWDELDTRQQHSLADQIQNIDFALVQKLYQSSSSDESWAELAAAATVPPAITLDDFADSTSCNRAIELGNEALARGRVGMILVAGGQGSRLGFEHPKGMFRIGPISNRSLFEMHIDLIRARSNQFGVRIPLYVMTSPPTDDETKQFLTEHNHFGLEDDDLKIFCQGTMPAVDQDGKLLLEKKSTIFASPDGHGGMLAALSKSGCLDHMQQRGIQHLFYGQVDNPLIQIGSPALLGYHLQSHSEMTSQVIRKTDPLQKVGVVVMIDGVARIIEYSDLPEENARETNPDGSLRLWPGSIAFHIFETDFLRRAVAEADSLPFHRALKKVAFVDSTGKMIEPETPNATKFEKFIFDLLPLAKNPIVCEVDPADGFCAVKNAAPAASETPQHVKQAIIDLHTRWLTEAGVKVKPGTPVEINPLFAIDVEQLSRKMPRGITIERATYFEG